MICVAAALGLFSLATDIARGFMHPHMLGHTTMLDAGVDLS